MAHTDPPLSPPAADWAIDEAATAPWSMSVPPLVSRRMISGALPLVRRTRTLAVVTVRLPPLTVKCSRTMLELPATTP